MCQFTINFYSMWFSGRFCKISSDQNNNGRSLCNRILNLSGVLIFLVRMIDKYGEEIFQELEEEKQNKEEKEAAVF